MRGLGIIYGNRTKSVRCVDDADADDDDDDGAAQETTIYAFCVVGDIWQDAGACSVSASSDSFQFFIFILTTFVVHHSFTLLFLA